MSLWNTFVNNEENNQNINKNNFDLCSPLLGGNKAYIDETAGQASAIEYNERISNNLFDATLVSPESAAFEMPHNDPYYEQQNEATAMPLDVQISHLSQAIALYNLYHAPASNLSQTFNNLNSTSTSTKIGTSLVQNNYFCSSTYIQDGISKLPLLGVATTVELQKQEQRKRDNHDGFGTRRPNKQFETEFRQMDFNKIQVDLPLIGMTTKSIEQNTVLRLFGLFRQMHIYLHERLPSRFNSTHYDEFEDQFSARETMPSTMNVHTQIKQVLHKCTIFLCNLEKILNSNKIFDTQMYVDGERSVKDLKKLIEQLETFKSVNFDHNYGKFVKEETNGSAQRLEMLLELINGSIRENKLFVHLFQWKMEAKRKREDTNWNIGDDQATGTDVSNYTKIPVCYANYMSFNAVAESLKNYNNDTKSKQLEYYFNNDNEFC